jgi:hypothetical protein
MQCLQCGETQPAENLFCTNCGARLAQERPSAPPEEEPQAIAAASVKQEEEKILRELKDALRGVEPKKVSDDSAPERAHWGTAKKLALVGIVTGFIIVLVVGMELLRKRRIGQSSPPPPPLETVLKSEPEKPAIDDALRTTVGKMAAMVEAIDQYSKTKRSLPTSLTSLNRSYADPDASKDGWGQNVLYLVDLANKTYVLRSNGPDGRRQTGDDISVDGDSWESWLKEHEQTISEWRVANPNLHAQLMAVGPSPEELKKLEAARKLEEEKKRQQAEAAAVAQKLEEEQKLDAARQEEERRKLAEAQKREEEQRQARLREETLRQQQAARRPESLRDNFIDGLGKWDAPSGWEVVKEKEASALRVQGLGFLKTGEGWDNYKIEFEVKVSKESAGWVLRAQNSNNFYLFKLGSEKAKAIPKNSLVKYIRSDDKYLNSLRREDAPGAAGVTPLPFKVRNKDYYKVTLVVRGDTMTHYIDGVQVDAWSDDTFGHGRFGFNASAIEQAMIRSLSIEPLR